MGEDRYITLTKGYNHRRVGGKEEGSHKTPMHGVGGKVGMYGVRERKRKRKMAWKVGVGNR